VLARLGVGRLVVAGAETDACIRSTLHGAFTRGYDATLVERHGKALTNLQVAAMAQDLDTVMFQPGILQEHEVLDRVPVNTRISVLALAHLLGQHKSEFVVNLEHLKSNYVRRGLRRVQGVRDERAISLSSEPL